MRRTCLGAALVAAALTLSSEAFAGRCSSDDLKGVWVLVISEGSRCIVEIDKAARITKSNCYFSDFSRRTGALTGSLQVSRQCTISGSVTSRSKAGKEKFAITGSLKGRERNFKAILTSGASVTGVEGIRQW